MIQTYRLRVRHALDSCNEAESQLHYNYDQAPVKTLHFTTTPMTVTGKESRRLGGTSCVSLTRWLPAVDFWKTVNIITVTIPAFLMVRGLVTNKTCIFWK
jgi:hypothetical protein